MFREHALIVIRDFDEACAVAAALNEFPQGVLRVTMPRSFGRRRLIPHLPEFLDEYPRIDVDAVVTDEVLNIIDSRIDLAVRIGALPDSQLMARQLAVHRRIVCASPGDVAENGTPDTPAELAGRARGDQVHLEGRRHVVSGRHIAS